MEENLRKIVADELVKVINEDYDYAANEIGYHDNSDYESFEAEISTALSFMQDIQGSSNNIKKQKELGGTNSEVDAHLEAAYKHVNEAIQSYFKSLSPDVKEEVIQRLGEINIDA